MNAVPVPEEAASVRRGLRRLQRLARYVRPYWKRATVGIAAMLVATGAGLAGPYLAKLAIDEAIVPRDLTTLTWIVVSFLIISMIGFAAQGVQTYQIGYAGERVLTDLRGDLFGHLQGLELGYYERNRAGVLISRLTNDVEALQQLVTDGLTSTVSSTLALVGSTAILFWLDWRLALADHHRVPADGGRDRHVPRLLGARLPAHARAAGAGHRDAAGRPVRRPRDAGVRPRGDQPRELPLGQRLLP